MQLVKVSGSVSSPVQSGAQKESMIRKHQQPLVLVQSMRCGVRKREEMAKKEREKDMAK